MQGQTVTGIGDYAFSVAGKIAVLTLPSTLKTIGNGVFEGHALTSLVIPDGVTSIGHNAFAGNALASVTLPAGLQMLGNNAFAYNLITSISLPNGLTSVGDMAFYSNRIKTLFISNTIEYIGYASFANNEITSLNIPGSVQTIEREAFSYNLITSLTIPNTLTYLGGEAFYDNNISTLNFEPGCQLDEINDYCFSLNDIKNLFLPNSVRVIRDFAFYGNFNLSGITFGNNLFKIRRGAFRSCNLTSLNLPGSLVFIGRYAFADNLKLSNFKLPVSANDYTWNDSNGDAHNEGDVVNNLYFSYVALVPYTLKDEDVVVVGGVITQCSYFDDLTNIASVITIPEQLDGQTITGIDNGVFYDKGISEVVLPSGLIEIGNSAFYRNEIIHLTIPNSVETIGVRAFFDNCINTLTFEPTSSLEFIGRQAFYVNRLVQVTIPQSVIIIDKEAFSNNLLENVTFEANSELLSIGSYAFFGNWGLTGFTLPDPTANGYSHWVDWDNVEYSTKLDVSNFETFYKIPIEYTLTDDDVVVVDGVIVSYTPANPYANILTIPDTLDGQRIVGIGDAVFAEAGLIGVQLPSSLETIGYMAFYYNDIIKLTIPASVTEIQGNSFSANIINELVFEENSSLRYIGWSSFNGNKITSLIIPDSVNYIGSYAFASNQISNEIVIPDSVEVIERGAFRSNQISSVIFSENSLLNFLGSYAFAYNQISNEILIPTLLTEIQAYAFFRNLISQVIVHEGIVEYGLGAFANNDPTLTIILHQPPTIPFVTHFFGWKDNDGIYHFPGEAIPDFTNRYKAVIDQYFVVKFIVENDNGERIENATINFYNSTLSTDANGIDSIGPVLRGVHEYQVSAPGCFDFAESVDVQDDMTILVVLTLFYDVTINVVDIHGDPVSGAVVELTDTTAITDSGGSIRLIRPDGEYPFTINAPGYQNITSNVTVLDSDTSITIVLPPVLVNYYPNGGIGEAFSDTTKGSGYSILSNPFTRFAYTFSHWNTRSDGTGTTYYEGDQITLEYLDIDLYAIWNPVDYNIIYHLDGGVNHPGNPDYYNIESEIDLMPADKPTLYFATWLDADSNRVSRIEPGTTGDIELWAVFTSEPTYYIDYYNLGNGTHDNPASYTQYDLPISFTDAIKTGYEFAGWFEDSLFTNPINSVPVGSTSNYDVYARWGNAIEYEITYHLGGGVNDPNNPVTYTIESEDILFKPPSKTGAVFTGWFSDSGHTTTISGIPQGSVGDTSLYAGWQLDTFAIQYVLNGGVNDSANPVQYTIDSEDIDFEDPARTGATFLGWYTDSLFTRMISRIPKGSTGDTTLYAYWQLDVYDIRYELDGGSNDPSNPPNYTIESDNIQFASPTKPGARFMAWYSDSSFTSEITGIPQGSTGDTTLYALWELDTFAIQYVLYGGINDPLNPLQYTVESDTIVFEDPARQGYFFEGWFSDSLYSLPIQFLPKGSIGDTALFAKWTEIFSVYFIITTDGETPAPGVDIGINGSIQFQSDQQGLADTLVIDGTSFSYTVEIEGIVIDDGVVKVAGSNDTVVVEIMDCYMRWFDVIFCDNGMRLWTDFVWYKDGVEVSNTQFFHQPGGITDGSYRIQVTSINGKIYTWENKYLNGNFEGNVYKKGDYAGPTAYTSEISGLKVFPNPVAMGEDFNVELPDNIDLKTHEIMICNVTGARVLALNNPGYINTIRIDHVFAQGLYYVVVTSSSEGIKDVKEFIVHGR